MGKILEGLETRKRVRVSGAKFVGLTLVSGEGGEWADVDIVCGEGMVSISLPFSKPKFFVPHYADNDLDSKYNEYSKYSIENAENIENVEGRDIKGFKVTTENRARVEGKDWIVVVDMVGDIKCEIQGNRIVGKDIEIELGEDVVRALCAIVLDDVFGNGVWDRHSNYIMFYKGVHIENEDGDGGERAFRGKVEVDVISRPDVIYKGGWVVMNDVWISPDCVPRHLPVTTEEELFDWESYGMKIYVADGVEKRIEKRVFGFTVNVDVMNLNVRFIA